MEIKNNKKTIRAWAMFDWANSAYNLVITSTIFPAYYVAITENPKNHDMVTFFGHRFVNTALSDYALAAAYMLMVILLPILSSIADYKGNKKIIIFITGVTLHKYSKVIGRYNLFNKGFKTEVPCFRNLAFFA